MLRTSLTELTEGFLHLLYPRLCVACNRDTAIADASFCMKCYTKLHVVEKTPVDNNPFTDRIWGRFPFSQGTSMYYFSRKNPVQAALHHLKYKNKPDIGVKLGRSLGAQLAALEGYRLPDVLLPVPLHPKKERLRGYNQSAMFAKGIAQALNIPLAENCLVRPVYSISQTSKSRAERYHNVAEVFCVKKIQPIQNKHVLLVDDVLTTGATLEACSHALWQAGIRELSLATIAVAVNRNY